MAFPTLEGTPGQLSQTTNATAHAVPYPTVSGGILAGDLLLLTFALDGGTNSVTDYNGFTALVSGGGGSTVNCFGGVAYKWAAGGESGTVTFTCALSEHGTWQMFCIRGANSAINPQASALVAATSTNPDPPSLTPTGMSPDYDILWGAFEFNDDLVIPTAPPSAYDTWSALAGDTSSASHAIAWRAVVTTAQNPGAFTMATEQWGAATIAIKGGAALPPAPSNQIMAVA